MSAERFTLGLNMIVGPGEGKELDRCLRSLKASEVFDEIIIGRTTHDPEVEAVCEKYHAKHFYHEWRSDRYPYGNFAEARNAVLDRTTTDYIWWADADDYFVGDRDDIVLKVRDVVTTSMQKDIDVWFMEYTIKIDEKMNTLCCVWRDRIFRRGSKFRWRYVVHELAGDNWNKKNRGNLYGARMLHLPCKPRFSSAYRNVQMLEHEINNGDNSSRTRFFYARDMMIAGRVEEALAIYDKDISELRSRPEDLYVTCMDLAFYYAYGGATVKPVLSDMKKENAAKIEKYLRLALAFSTTGAEPYTMLGDLYIIQQRFDSAKKCYAAALEKKMKSGLLQMKPFYEEIPALRLSDYYMARNEYETALLFNKRSIAYGRSDYLVVQRRAILDKLCEQEGIRWVQV